VGALLLKINNDAQQSRIFSEQKGLATRVARDIARYVTNLQRELDLRMRPGSSIQQSAGLLADAASSLSVRNSPNLIDVAVLDETGKERMRIHRLLRMRE